MECREPDRDYFEGLSMAVSKLHGPIRSKVSHVPEYNYSPSK